MITSDFLVVGGGIIGINVAMEIKKRYTDSKVILIEKEKECGLHASGRNSGVLHAGFYYTPESLKAKFTQLGNELLTKYCEDKGVPINKCGKLVVAKNEYELPLLDELIKRGRKNGVLLKEVCEEEAKEIEPRILTYKKAIFSPTTSTIDPLVLIKKMKLDALNKGVEIHCGIGYIKREKNDILTTKGKYNTGYFVNAAGLYADKIALDFGFSEKYRILPFKGIYLYSDEPKGSLKTNVYPVPNLKYPFLGVHFTITVDKGIKIGPTALPAFWREQYHLTDNFNFSEFLDIIIRESNLLLFSNFDFKKLAFEEISKFSRTRLVELASCLVKNVNECNYTRWGEAGIRAQLINVKERKLEMDFVVEGDNKSIHILNVVSPGLTCTLPFSSYICDQIALASGIMSSTPNIMETTPIVE